MNRGLLLFMSPVALVALMIACGSNSSSPTTPSSSTPVSSTDPSLTAPALRSPSLGEQIETIQPELQIGNATGGSGPRTYTFEISSDSGFRTIVLRETDVREGLGGVTMFKVEITLLEADTQYHWRARAETSAGTGPYSEQSNFVVKAAFTRNRPSGVVVFDPLNNGGTIGTQMGGNFVPGGWQPELNTDCIRYQIPTLIQGIITFETRNVNSPNPMPGKRMLISMWDPSKGEYTTNPFRMHLQKLDRSTVRFDDVRLRWISRGQETNTGITFFDFEPDIDYSWRIEWGKFPGIPSQHVKIFLDGFEILNRNYDREYSPNPHWVELGNCERAETLEEAIWSNLIIQSR